MTLQTDTTAQHVTGAPKTRLQLSLMVNFFLLMALYSGVLGVLLPNQIADLDESSKEGNLALLYFITSIFSTLTTPIAGALSARTRTKWGRRSPWIAVGALIGSACLFGVAWQTAFLSVLVLWVMATVAYNSMQPALTTVIADRFAPEARGVVSGFVGAGMTVGLTAGTITAGYLAGDRVLAYGLFAAAIAMSSVAFVLINREPVRESQPAREFNLATFARSFWISPKKHPDFAWAFAGRFTVYMGYQAVVAYMLYILRDHIGLANDDSNRTIANLAFVTMCFVAVTALSAGWLSDKLQRRKPFVIAASFIMCVAMAAPLLMPTMSGMWIYAAVIGIGYGLFMSIDTALMTQVLPKTEDGDEGKDLGLLTTAINIPQIISPVMAFWLLKLSGGDYSIIFIVAMAFSFVSAFCIMPIRSVR